MGSVGIGMPKPNPPCLNCPDRFVKDGHTCHETCEKYIKFRTGRMELWQERADAIHKENVVNAFKVAAVMKSTRRKPIER